ncbi:MAG: Zn-dependent exopeptidase M28 [Treponema sp.]|jgi:hypothetical protein|nr:Zn-dependent exopeptidase M28 [Treponema sp.]
MMYEAPWNEKPYCRFMEFIRPQADRYLILRDMLEEMGFDWLTINLEGNRHFFVLPSGRNLLRVERPAAFMPKTVLTAHYDRVEGSPGANDNSAAVFELLDTALKLRERRLQDYLIIFTDKEELRRGEGVRDQGSFALGRFLRRLGMGALQVFIFDACGTGDSLIISTMADYLLKDDKRPGTEAARQLARHLRRRALETARKLSMEKVLLIPTPFSDDAGFLRAGIIAQTITMLPSLEAAPFASLIRKRPGFSGALISRERQEGQDIRLIPETWRNLNGPADSHLRLTPEHFKKVVRFALALCGD